VEQAAGTRAFDTHNPPSAALLDECVHCGFCLPTCPTYALWQEEMDSPRGRIYLMKLALEGEIELNETVVGHFDACLGCMACVTACPSGVQYDQLIEATRAQVERRYPRGPGDRLFRRLLFAVLPYPRRLRALLPLLRLYQRSGVQALLRRSGILRRVPARLRALDTLLPPARRSPERSAPAAALPTVEQPRLRVGLFTGCVQSGFFGEVNAATARVLAAEGCEVVVPPDQGCCGALMQHAGVEEGALERARRTIEAFERAAVDVVAVNAAGCGSAMKEYGRLLAGDAAWAERARAFAARCRDVSEVLDGLEPRAARHPLPPGRIRVAYHDACHLQHAQRIQAAPRRLLSAIPGLELVEIPEAAVCCGSAGIYNLVEPAAAAALGERKARSILGTGAEIVATGNPGCTLQIGAGLEGLGEPLPVVHVIQLIDASIRGVAPPI
jgi:glycolate oxidase iron-sulfur subunit